MLKIFKSKCNGLWSETSFYFDWVENLRGNNSFAYIYILAVTVFAKNNMSYITF